MLKDQKALEGCSSMVHDRKNKVIYMSESVRSNVDIFRKHATMVGYKPIVFGTQSL